MASLNVDLPDELLAEVNRVAQELNVTRQDVFRRAIVALSRAQEMEDRMDRLSRLHAEASAYRQELTGRMTSQRGTMVALSGELAGLRRQVAAMAQGRRALLHALSWLRTDALRGMAVREKLARERDAALKGRARTEKLLDERSYAALNSLEVGKLRRDLAALKKSSEAELARERAATHRAERSLGRLRGELAKARKELSAVAKLLSPPGSARPARRG